MIRLDILGLSFGNRSFGVMYNENRTLMTASFIMQVQGKNLLRASLHYASSAQVARCMQR